MPCCAFAAFVFSQLVLGIAVLKRVVFGGAEAGQQTNAAVEWRLGEPGAPIPGKTPWRPRRLAAPLFVVAAVLEIALVVGAIYGVRAHFGHAPHGMVQAAGVR